MPTKNHVIAIAYHTPPESSERLLEVISLIRSSPAMTVPDASRCCRLMDSTLKKRPVMAVLSARKKMRTATATRTVYAQITMPVKSVLSSMGDSILPRVLGGPSFTVSFMLTNLLFLFFLLYVKLFYFQKKQVRCINADPRLPRALKPHVAA